MLKTHSMMNIQSVVNLNNELTGKTAEEILEKILNLSGEEIAFSTSLGAEDQVLTHLISQINPNTRIFTLDTGRLFPETYNIIERTIDRYGINIETYFPNYQDVEEMVNNKGINLFYASVENRKLCCDIRKTRPLKRALKDVSIWITGLRREQSVTRTGLNIVSWDEQFKLVKVNPLLDWSEQDVWDFIKKNNVPYNKLHDKGFPSIGCQPCTRAIKPGEDVRAGRWWWENPDTKECGIHKA